jgi:hypothetical protein
MKAWPPVVALLLVTTPSLAGAQGPAPVLEPGRDVEDTYARNKLAVIEENVSAAWSLLPVAGGHTWYVVRGKYRQPVAYEDFYKQVGQPELADRYRGRLYLSRTIMVLGYAGVIAGGWLVFTDRPLAGFGLFGLGAASAYVGGHLQPPVESPEDAARMAGAYNDGLRARLMTTGGPAPARQVGLSWTGRWP